MELKDLKEQVKRIYADWAEQYKTDAKSAGLKFQSQIDKLAADVAISDLPNGMFFSHLLDSDIFGYQKQYWLLGAKVLIKRGYENIKEDLETLLIWFQDLNWPGAWELFEYLASSHDEEILLPLEKAISAAVETKDEEWLHFLCDFADLAKIDLNCIQSQKIQDHIAYHKKHY